MDRRTTFIFGLGAALLITVAAVPGRAQQATPSTQPAKLSLSDLRTKATAAFEASDYVMAMPLLKDLAVRMRNEPEKVAPILEQIRVCEANLPANTIIEGINAPRNPHVKPADGQAYEVALQKLGNFQYDPDKGEIPDDVKALNGIKVRIKGYMQLVSESDNITRFQLVPDRFACCFGQPPQIQHTSMVSCPAGKSVKYFPDMVWVEGTLKVGEQRDEGFVLAIFEVTANSIRPVEN